MLAHLGTLVPGERTPKLLGKPRYGFCYGIPNRFGPMTRKCRPILFARLMAMPWQWRQMKQDREPRRSLDQCANRGTRQPKYQVSFPMARYGAIFDLGWTLTDEK